MTPDTAIQLGRDTIYAVLLVAGPMLLTGLVIGLVVSVLQALTQVHEMTITFIPKITGMAVTVAIFMPWMLRVLLTFTTKMIVQMASLVK